jgi:hypothetical protein
MSEDLHHARRRMQRWLIIAASPFVLVAAILGWAHYRGKPLPEDGTADLGVVEKSGRVLTLYAQGEPP